MKTYMRTEARSPFLHFDSSWVSDSAVLLLALSGGKKGTFLDELMPPMVFLARYLLRLLYYVPGVAHSLQPVKGNLPKLEFQVRFDICFLSYKEIRTGCRKSRRGRISCVSATVTSATLPEMSAEMVPGQGPLSLLTLSLSSHGSQSWRSG